MPDLVDAILDRLSPSTRELLDCMDMELPRESQNMSEDLQMSLKTMEDAHFDRCTREINSKTELFGSLTRKNNCLLEQYNAQLEKLQSEDRHLSQPEKLKAYACQIENMKRQLQDLMRSSEKLEPDEIFSDISEMSMSIEELEWECKEMKHKLKCYEDFPPSIREAQYCILSIKERIKKKEALLESNFYNKKAQMNMV